MMKPKIIELEQGSPEWLSYRKTKITATDTGVILNLNPWKTPLQLWEEKLCLREPQAVNDKMREGSLMEEKAREYFNKTYDSDFKPVVLESFENSFMMASLDGINSKGEILEIKCGKKSYESAYDDIIEPYYFSQIQKQMYVANCDRIIYLCYRSDNEFVQRKYFRDEIYIKKMIEDEKQFYQCLLNFTPPSLCDRDFAHIDTKEWRLHTEIWKDTKKQIKMLEAREEALRNELIAMCNGESSQGNGVRVSKQITKGRVDYSKIDVLKNIDLEKYRGKNVTSYRFTEMKGQD